MAQQRLVGQFLLLIEASRSHSETSQWVGFLWRRNHSDTETYIMSPARLEPTSPASKQTQTQALDRVTTEIRMKGVTFYKIEVKRIGNELI